MSDLPQGYKIRDSLNPKNRRLTLDKLTTGEIRGRIALLRDSNADMMTAHLRKIDEEIEAAQNTLTILLGKREEELRAIDIDLADWSSHQLRIAGLRRVT